MTTPEPPPDAELVSAYLDGEATPAERARVESDPVLLAEVEQYRQVAALIRQPVAPDPARREQAIAAALGVLDGSVVPFSSGQQRAGLPPSAARPARRRPTRWLALAAAAAVAVVIAVAGVVITRDDGGNEVVAPTTEQPGGPGSTGTSGNPDFPGATNIPTSPPAVSRVVELGAFADLDALIAAVAARPEAGQPAPGRTITHECRPIGAQAAYSATVAGDEVSAFLAPGSDRRLTEGTIYGADCAEIETFTLDD